MQAIIQSDRDFDTWRGKLRGKFVLTAPMRQVAPRFDPLARRFNDNDLTDLSKQPPTGRGRGGAPAGGPNPQEFARKRMQFFVDEGVAALLEPSPNGDGGTFFVQSAPNVTRDPKEPAQAPQVVLSVEQYGRLLRTLEKKVPVTLQMDIDSRFYDDDLNAFNIVAELPGTDKADEVVMLGAHFDSWHAGTGATDNAAGSAVMMEAMRILKTSGLRLRRTVRVALWAGEEEGLLGSAAYVRAHFADRATMELKAEHAKLSGYFNVDNGTGGIRGVYLQGHESRRPDLPELDGAVEESRHDDAGDSRHRRHRSPVVRRGGTARLSVHPGSARVRFPHASLQPGRLRARSARRHDAQRRHRRVVRVPHGQSRREAAAQAVAARSDGRPG